MEMDMYTTGWIAMVVALVASNTYSTLTLLRVRRVLVREMVIRERMESIINGVDTTINVEVPTMFEFARISQAVEHAQVVSRTSNKSKGVL